MAAEKTLERIDAIQKETLQVESDENFLFIKSEYKILRINLYDIKYISPSVNNKNAFQEFLDKKFLN